ncbi:sensor histidine kinase [Chitinophaga sancti]|uniref:histidine kinase n=1 Tax=Chitinophaga sancti TaxID=1004 RepID=A0A1K1MNL4_9BACT|nr:ATP-binding protein [Chitinophaga sancti]WQD62840.1 ATP-binding protein [Chitinophaga sancti]WQG91536.1 ATP-binding protein [Chitinophaga sancti]SFW24744.1 PAS domain S-box-containing protein [Chitinophaga sancti]
MENEIRQRHAELYDLLLRYIKTDQAELDYLDEDGPGMELLSKSIQVLGKRLQDAERKLAATEKLLKTSQDTYASLLGEIQDYAIITLDLDGNIVNWNKGAERIKGYTAKEIVGKNFRVFYTPAARADKLPEKLLAAAIRDGRVQHEDYRVRKDGTLLWSSVTITALHNNEGELTGFIKITRDLSEKKLMEDQTLLYLRKLEMENKELEQFTYIASHDLQEPLRSISTLVELVAKEYAGKLDDTADSYLRFIRQSSNRMSDLIKALLDYSRIGKVKVKEAVDCNQVVLNAVDDLRTAIHESKAQVVLENLPIVQAYPVELKLLFQNLLSNAIKFRQKHVPPVVRITCVKKEHEYEFTFADNGIGIAPRYQEKVFEIFQRLHNQLQYEGTGIGLAHCKKIVTLHGGRIWLSSIPGEGSQFYFTISA